MMSLSLNLLTFCAFDLMIVDPSVTWPSPAIATEPFLRTETIVVPCQTGNEVAHTAFNFLCDKILD